MSFRFIIGRAGSGKTTNCLETIKENIRNNKDKNLIFLVPEQATFQYEMELSKSPDLGGIINCEVLSFRRLAFRVLSLVGGTTRRHIGELGKKMMLRKFLDNRKDSLKVFKRASNQVGFVDKLASAISEFKLYQVKVGDLENLRETLDSDKSLLSSKLDDLYLIYKDLEDYLENKYVDPDDYLNLLAERIPLCKYIEDAEIWIDGFIGFTPQELKVIEALARVSKDVNITFTLDTENIRDNSSNYFLSSYKTYQKITDIAQRNNVKVEKNILLDDEIPYRFQKSYALAYLEKNFFNFNSKPYEKEVNDIKILACQNHRAEVEDVARKIRTLCREHNYHYRDIGILVRDFKHYDLLIETIFPLYDIPFFLDRKKQVMHHPLVELIRSALEIVEEGFKYEPIFRYLKTGLVNITRDEVDILENYALACGLRGEVWYKLLPLEYHPKYKTKDIELTDSEKEELNLLNDIKNRAVFELVKFKEKIGKADKTEDYVAAIYELLMDISVPDKLEIWADAARQKENIEKVREHVQIWDGIVEILDQLVETLGDEEISLNSFYKIIYAGLESLKLGFIPPGLDQVIIGSLERSRNPNLKAIFVLGVGEGILPAKVSREGLFDDREREKIKEKGLILAPSSREKLIDEQFMIYIALTRSGNKLFISYPVADGEGKALRPSIVINRVKELYPYLKEEMVSLDPQGENDIDFISHPDRTLGYLGSRLRLLKEGSFVDPSWWAVYDWFLDKPLKANLKKIIKGYNHKNQEANIPPNIAKKLFHNPLRISVSRVERYQTCAFLHFLKYGLCLEEREIFEFKSPDLGQFLHKVMEQFAYELKKEGKDWAEITENESDILIDNIVEEVTPKLQKEILLSTARLRFFTKKFKKTLKRAVMVLKEHAKRGKFKPVGLEIDFGFDNKKVPGLTFTLEDGSKMELVGQIDRLDACMEDDKCFLRVIDYKSGQAGLSLLEIYYGFKLQLLTYLHVVLNYFEKTLNNKTILPAGVFYFYLKNPILSEKGPLNDEEIEKEIIKNLKMSGLLLADIEAFKLMDSETMSGFSPLFPVAINKEGQKALKGEIELDEKDSLDLFDKRSKVVSKEQIELLINYIESLIIKGGEEIIKGNIKIDPYKYKENTACDYCIYKSVCQFDKDFEDNEYRMIKDIKNEEIWEKIRGCKGE